MKFKVGDKVKAVKGYEGNNKIKGQIGIVKYVGESSYRIEFINDVDGHNGNESDWRGRNGHCWFVHSSCLIFVGKATINLSHIKPFGIVGWMNKYYKTDKKRKAKKK